MSTLIRVEIPRDAAHWLREVMIATASDAFYRGASAEARHATSVAQAIRSGGSEGDPMPSISVDMMPEPHRSLLASGQAAPCDGRRPEVRTRA